jgi:hypothetical protein
MSNHQGSSGKAQSAAVPINAASVRELLRELFPDRENTSTGDILRFIEEVSEVGYTEIQPLKDGILAGLDEALEEELRMPIGDPDKLDPDLAIASSALAVSSEAYSKIAFRPLAPDTGVAESL